jgi:hypothetical protein
MENTSEAPLQPAPPPSPIPTLKTAAHILARHRVYRRNHPDKVKSWHRADYQRHRDRVIARAVRQRKEKREANCVLPEELKLYQNDSLRETNLGITAFVVCRECGWKGTQLNQHVRKLHATATAAYLDKWNYPSLVAPDFRLRAAEEKKHWRQADPEKHKFFHTREGENKRRELVPGESIRKRAGKPATPAQRRRWIEQGQRLSGKPRHDRRGKKLIGPNRQSGTWVDAPPVDDAVIAEARLAGKTYREIEDEVDRAQGAVRNITKLCGFPPGIACTFLHGEPLTKRHFRELCEDFRQSKKAVIEAAGLGYASVMNHLGKIQDQDVLSTKVGGALLDLRRKWTYSHCFHDASRTRVRDFLVSELHSLPLLQSRLRAGLQALRTWLRSAGKDAITTWRRSAKLIR